MPVCLLKMLLYVNVYFGEFKRTLNLLFMCLLNADFQNNKRFLLKKGIKTQFCEMSFKLSEITISRPLRENARLLERMKAIFIFYRYKVDRWP